jgi:Metallo-peptidase family M12/Reprolysin family propeptide
MEAVKFSRRTRSKRPTVRTPALLVRSLRPTMYVSTLLTLVAAALLAMTGMYPSPAGAQSTRARYQQAIDQVFTGHEDLTLDPHAAVEQVRESGRLSLVTPTRDFEIQLRPNDLRAQNYRAEEVIDGGVTRAVAMPAVTTYKGSVEGKTGSDARFTLDGDHVEGMIITPDESYFIESGRKYSGVAAANDYVIYRATDVRPDLVKTCATLEEEIGRSAKDVAPKVTSDAATPDAFSPFKVVDLATEADFEYTSALGGSAAANNDILSIMNGVQAVFQRDVGVTFNVVFQHTWATQADPYNANGDPVAMLNEFTTVWNRDFSGTARDLAHLWTGRSLGGSAGIAWTGVVCADPSHSYGLSDFETIAPFRIGIPAHEIGHNFSASHSDGQAGCANTIMVATQEQTNSLTFCQFSIDEMTNFINRNSACLSNAPAGNPIDQPDFFVKQQYLDFLNRTADPAGLSFWTNEITSCGGDPACVEGKRVNVSAAFFLSIEFQQTGYLVERIYKTAYGDADGTSTFNGTHTIKVPIVRFVTEFLPDTQQIGQGVVVGQDGWEAVLEKNKQAFCDQFVTRQRFTAAYPSNMLPTTFVDTLNRNSGSPLSPAELTQLEVEHATGAKNRSQVLRQIAEHQNLVNAEFNRALVLMQFFGYLRRNPNDAPDSDYSGFDFWLTKLNSFTQPGDDVLVRVQKADMVKSFLVSAEYRRRFGTP